MDTSVIDHFRSLSAVSHTTPIDTLVLNRFYSIFAVVRDDNVRGKSRKGDYMLTMVLLDPTAKVPLGVSMFAKTIERVPEELKAGTVIKLSNLKIQEFNGKLQGLSTFQTTIKQYYFTGSTMDQEGDPDFSLAKHLHSWYTARLSGNVQSDATLMTKGRRNVWTISQLKSARDCFDLYCQVMCVQQQDGLGGMVLLVSDFTSAAFSNGVSMRDESLLYSVAKDCLRVTIWDDNMDVENMLKTNEGGPTLAQIERGTYLFLRNLFSKDARDADGTATIEASLHSERGEKSMGGRWQILDRDHIEVKKIRRRMEEQGLTINKDSTNLTVTPAYIPLTPLRQILAENPQLPTRYKFEASVVDHLPTKLEYFSRVMCDYCGCSYKDGMCSKCGNSDTGRVRWMFSLLLGDGADSFMPVVVSGDDADQFLKFEAKDMKSDQECLQRLRTALSGLWVIGGEGQVRVTGARKALFCVQSYRVDGIDDVRFKLIATELIW